MASCGPGFFEAGATNEVKTKVEAPKNSAVIKHVMSAHHKSGEGVLHGQINLRTRGKGVRRRGRGERWRAEGSNARRDYSHLQEEQEKGLFPYVMEPDAEQIHTPPHTRPWFNSVTRENRIFAFPHRNAH